MRNLNRSSRPAALAAIAASSALILAATAPSARAAAFIEFSTGIDIPTIGTVPAVPPASVTTGTESVTVGSFTYTAPNATFHLGDGNAVTLTGLATNAAPPHANAGDVGTDIVLGRISVDPSGPADAVSFNYAFSVDLAAYDTVTAVNPAVVIDFGITGHIAGSLGDFSTNLTNAYSPLAGGGIFTLRDGSSFVVTPKTFTAPGLDTPGAFGVHVQAVAPGPTVPEPSSVLLLGAVAPLAIRRRRACA